MFFINPQGKICMNRKNTESLMEETIEMPTSDNHCFAEINIFQRYWEIVLLFYIMTSFISNDAETEISVVFMGFLINTDKLSNHASKESLAL